MSFLRYFHNGQWRCFHSDFISPGSGWVSSLIRFVCIFVSRCLRRSITLVPQWQLFSHPGADSNQTTANAPPKAVFARGTERLMGISRWACPLSLSACHAFAFCRPCSFFTLPSELTRARRSRVFLHRSQRAIWSQSGFTDSRCVRWRTIWEPY